MPKYEMSPIGYVRCPRLKTRADYNAKKKGELFEAEAVLNPELEDALAEIETFDRVWLI